MRVHMRHEGKVSAVAGFEEEGHACDQAEHGAFVVRVGETDSDEERSGDDGEAMDEVFLAPHAGPLVEEVGCNTAKGPEEDIEQPEHCGPVAGAGLSELREILDVVCAEDGVDCQLGSEGAEIASSGHECLQGENHGHCFFESGLYDDLTTSSLQHCLLANLSFVVKGTGSLGTSVKDHFSLGALVRWAFRSR